MTTCQEVGHCVNPDDTTNTCGRCGVTVGKPFWPDRALPQTDKTTGLQDLVVVPRIEGLREALRETGLIVLRCRQEADALTTVEQAARAYLALTEQQEKE